MQKTHNTLPEEIRIQSVELLNLNLAAAIDLHAQMKQAHWNVRGPGFIAIHALFDKLAGEAAGYADSLAERAGGLGGTAQGTGVSGFDLGKGPSIILRDGNVHSASDRPGTAV